MSDYFVFGDVDSRDYSDIHVFDKSVDNTPKRVYDVQNIAGRNGAFYVDQGRYEDVEHSYGVVALTKSAGSNFINALVSQIGYHRLSDSFNEDEFYLATLTDAVEAKVSKSTRDVNTFDITFTRKPQRFLLSGEVPKVVAQNMTPSSTNTESGSVVSIESDGGDAVTSLVAQIEPVQAGSGDPSPTNVRAITGHTSANVTVAGKNLIGFGERLAAWGSNYTDIGNDSYLIKSTGTGYREPYRFADEDIDVTLSGIVTDLEGSRNWRINLLNANNVEVGSIRQGETVVSGKASKIRLNYGAAGNGAIYEKIQLELGTQATPYESYKGTTATTALGRTVYGGTLDVVTGVLTVTWVAARIGALAWGYNSNGNYFYTSSVSKAAGLFNILSDIYATATVDDVTRMGDYHIKGSAANNNLFVTDSRYTTVADFKSANDQRYIYVEAATPQTYNLTAQQVELLTGQNHVWADTGDITLTYGADPYIVVNPTLFASKPLLKVTGHGVLTIGSQSITINGTSSTQVINIDCDTMEAWEMSGSAMIPRNDYIQNAGDDFPKLKPGANKITLGVGITQVVVTPRWWRV